MTEYTEPTEQDPDCGIPQEFAEAMGLMPKSDEQLAAETKAREEELNAMEAELPELTELLSVEYEEYAKLSRQLRNKHLEIVEKTNHMFGIMTQLGYAEHMKNFASSTLGDDLRECSKAVTTLVAHSLSASREYDALTYETPAK